MLRDYASITLFAMYRDTIDDPRDKEDALRAFIKSSLPSYYEPRKIIFLINQSLPMTSHGLKN